MSADRAKLGQAAMQPPPAVSPPVEPKRVQTDNGNREATDVEAATFQLAGARLNAHHGPRIFLHSSAVYSGS
jgi:hypothetical protein